jgi:antitoxin HicB
MDLELSYPVLLTPEPDGGFVTTFPDVPEAITQGDDVPDALEQAADALEEALVGRIRRGEVIPPPSRMPGLPHVRFLLPDRAPL